MTIAIDRDVKHLFKQTNKVRFNELAHYVINNFRDFAIVPCNTIEKSHYARFSFLYTHNCTYY